MDFEGKRCGECGNGKMHKFSEEVAAGIFAEAYKCDYQGHISYPEKTMLAIEAIRRQFSKERHVVKVGNSLAIPIPAEIVKILGLKPKEKVFVRSTGSEIIIRPSAF